jgi:hypothetical protein
MKYSRPVLLAAALVFALATLAGAQGTLEGDWELTIDTPQDTTKVSLSLAQAGEKLTGKLSSRMGSVPVTGTATGGALDLTAVIDFQGNNLQLGVVGKTEGEGLSGTVKFGDFGEFPFTGKRAAHESGQDAAAAAAVPAPPAPATNVAAGAAGKWNVTLTIPGVGEFPASATFTQDAAGVVGGTLSSAAGEVVVAGTMAGTTLKLEFKATTPQGDIPVVMSGNLTDTGLSGKASIVGLGEADWTATRVQ